MGESGTDKEAIARYLHAKSDRSEKPFVSVVVSALSSQEPFVELFGREKDGEIVHKGHLEKANGGTVFLKDIADMDPRRPGGTRRSSTAGHGASRALQEICSS